MKYVISDSKPEEIKKVELVQRPFGVEIVIGDRILAYLSHEKQDDKPPFKVWDEQSRKWIHFSDKGWA